VASGVGSKEKRGSINDCVYQKQNVPLLLSETFFSLKLFPGEHPNTFLFKLFAVCTAKTEFNKNFNKIFRFSKQFDFACIDGNCQR